MPISRIDSNARRSRAVIHGSTIYLAGQVADDRSAAIGRQTAEALAKVDDMLGRCGSDRSNILSATIYLKTMDDFNDMNKVWDAWVDPDNTPARACVKADMANPDYRIEITVVAAIT